MCVRPRPYASRSVRERLAEQNRRETVSIKEHYETGCVCVASVNGQRGAERSEYKKHSEIRLCVRAVF